MIDPSHHANNNLNNLTQYESEQIVRYVKRADAVRFKRFIQMLFRRARSLTGDSEFPVELKNFGCWK